MLRPIQARRGTGARAADRHVEHAVATERDPAHFRIDVVGHEDLLHVGERLAVPRAAANGIARQVVADRLVVGEVDPAVLLECRMQHDIHQPCLGAAVDHLRHSGNRVRIDHAVADDAKRAGTLGDQNRAVGQERETVWMREALRDDRHTDLLRLGRLVRPRTSAKGRRRQRLRPGRHNATQIAHDRIGILLLGRIGRLLTRSALLTGNDRDDRDQHHRENHTRAHTWSDNHLAPPRQLPGRATRPLRTREHSHV